MGPGNPGRCALLAASALFVFASGAMALPELHEQGAITTVEGSSYRVTMPRDVLDVDLEIRDGAGQWYRVAQTAGDRAFGLLRGPDALLSPGLRATWATEEGTEAIVIGRQAVLDMASGIVFELHLICHDEGILLGGRLIQPQGAPADGAWWCPPRLGLAPHDWTHYTYYSEDGSQHDGALSDLLPYPAYAGVSPWGAQGDVAPRLSDHRPALAVRAPARGLGLAVVFADYAAAWEGGSAFVQRYNANSLFLYGGYIPASTDGMHWAWLAPCPAEGGPAAARRVDELVALGPRLLTGFAPIASEPPAAWREPLADFPPELRNAEPVSDISDAVVYTVNEGTAGSAYGIDLARKVGSDVLVRAWFKWAQAPPVSQWIGQPAEAHKLGALFGGGITCSALYEHENGLTQEQVLDMATRGPAGQLIDAWDQPGVRHGSLSSPAYLDYLFRWCREQIDAGADYLFMDEHTAALSGLEGYDDHSLVDFRTYLLDACPQTRDWALEDPRWSADLGIGLADAAVCPDGTIGSFEYRAHLASVDALEEPSRPANRLFGLWNDFRNWRDDRAWKALTDRIRDYSRRQGRTVLISANGLARYVDLQVMGVWGQWTTDAGHIDVSANLVPHWRSLVERGHDLAGRRVPVVLFHDWGFGEVPFPWMAVPPSEREAWMRTRGAEIYASGAFFAFPVLGPFGCDAQRDGTLASIAHQTAYYRRHRAVYLESQWLGFEGLNSDAGPVSLSAGWNPGRQEVLVHVVSRNVRAGQLEPIAALQLRLPLATVPASAHAVSPDFEGERAVECRLEGDQLVVDLPGVEAYTVVRLRYDGEPDLTRLRDPFRIRPVASWTRPATSEFRVLPGGRVEPAADLVGFMQGMLHGEMRNPPVFELDAADEAVLSVHVRAVASAGARLEFRIDGQVTKVVDLPDRDGDNDGAVLEYDETFTVNIPAGKHRVTVDNVGPDWAVIDWYEFGGGFEAP